VIKYTYLGTVLETSGVPTFFACAVSGKMGQSDCKGKSYTTTYTVKMNMLYLTWQQITSNITVLIILNKLELSNN